MTKYEMITKGINLDRETQKLEQQKKEYIEHLLRVEEQLRNKWQTFANIFLTEEVFNTLKKIYNTPHSEYYIGFLGLPDTNGNPTKICINYFCEGYGEISFEVTENDEYHCTRRFGLKGLREGPYPLIHKEDLIKPDGTICSDYLLQTKANKLKTYETILRLLEINMQFFYEEICQRINNRIQGQKEFLSNLPKFEIETTQEKQYKVVIKIEEI